MKGQKVPSGKRTAKCPKCGLYYAPAGLIGHMRFYHDMGIGMDKQNSLGKLVEFLRQKNEFNKELRIHQLLELAVQHLNAGGSGLPKQVIDGALELLVIEYLVGSGIFKQK
jgi:hypothetical protein